MRLIDRLPFLRRRTRRPPLQGEAIWVTRANTNVLYRDSNEGFDPRRARSFINDAAQRGQKVTLDAWIIKWLIENPR